MLTLVVYPSTDHEPVEKMSDSTVLEAQLPWSSSQYYSVPLSSGTVAVITYYWCVGIVKENVLSKMVLVPADLALWASMQFRKNSTRTDPRIWLACKLAGSA